MYRRLKIVKYVTHNEYNSNIKYRGVDGGTIISVLYMIYVSFSAENNLLLILLFCFNSAPDLFQHNEL